MRVDDSMPKMEIRIGYWSYTRYFMRSVCSQKRQSAHHTTCTGAQSIKKNLYCKFNYSSLQPNHKHMTNIEQSRAEHTNTHTHTHIDTYSVKQSTQQHDKTL